jgi:hypothetical protein
MAYQYQLNDATITVSEDALLLAITNSRIAMGWNNEPESECYWQGQIDAYKSLLTGMI